MPSYKPLGWPGIHLLFLLSSWAKEMQNISRTQPKKLQTKLIQIKADTGISLCRYIYMPLLPLQQVYIHSLEVLS